MLKQYFTSIFLFLFVAYSAFAQSTGDYRTIGSGDWTDGSIWEYFDGTNWIDDSDPGFPGYPGENPGTNDVTITAGSTVQLGVDVTNAIGSLVIYGDLILADNGSYELNTLEVYVTPTGVIGWGKKSDLTLPAGAAIYVENPDGLDYSNGGCDVNKTLTIGTTVFSKCNGQGNTYTFDDINNAGGTQCLSDPVDITTHPSDQVVYVGDDADFSVVSSDADAFQWQVSVDGGLTYTDLPSETSSTLTLTSVLFTASGNLYRVQVFSGTYCKAFSDPATLTVNPRPTIITNRNKTYRVNN